MNQLSEYVLEIRHPENCHVTPLFTPCSYYHICLWKTNQYTADEQCVHCCNANQNKESVKLTNAPLATVQVDKQPTPQCGLGRRYLVVVRDTPPWSDTQTGKISKSLYWFKRYRAEYPKLTSEASV